MKKYPLKQVMALREKINYGEGWITKALIILPFSSEYYYKYR